jgi:beta-N-acetylhexosaminidase
MNHASHAVLWSGFDGLDEREVTQDRSPGGVVLFARNLDLDSNRGPARCKALLNALQRRWGSEATLAMAIDQEGGTVSRLRSWVGATPNFRDLWLRGGTEACERWGSLWGEGLRLLGFNVDFAPVSDLWAQGAAIGDRAASDDPNQVAAAVGAFLHGLESQGVRGCLKHFPGLGATTLDSHAGLPEQSNEAYIARGLRPFVALSNEDRLVMVAHLQTPHSGELPASLHRGSVLENPWGVRGRFLPDDLEMGGVSAWSWDERVRRCLEAGHDWLLVCQTERGIRACAEALEKTPDSLWANAAARSLGMRRNLRAPEFDELDMDAWHEWVARVQREASP